MDLHKIAIRPLSRENRDYHELDPASAYVQQLFESVTGSFGRRSALTHGAFGDDSEQQHPLPGILQSLATAEAPGNIFQQLTDTALDCLVKAVTEDTPSDEHDSQLLCMLYQSDRYLYLLLVLLEHETRLTLDSKLHPIETPVLAAERLVQALRVNLTRLGNGQDSYLSFVPGKRSGSVGQDFPTAFGCSEAVPARQCTRELIRATRDYCNQHQLNERKDEVVEDVVSYLERQRDDRQHASLNEIERLFDAYIPPEQVEAEGSGFSQFANGGPYEVSHEFQPHRATLKALSKVKTKSDNWQLDFARRSLGPTGSDRDILFDEAEQSLTLRRLPTRVIQTIREALEEE